MSLLMLGQVSSTAAQRSSAAGWWRRRAAPCAATKTGQGRRPPLRACAGGAHSRPTWWTSGPPAASQHAQAPALGLQQHCPQAAQPAARAALHGPADPGRSKQPPSHSWQVGGAHGTLVTARPRLWAAHATCASCGMRHTKVGAAHHAVRLLVKPQGGQQGGHVVLVAHAEAARAPPLAHVLRVHPAVPAAQQRRMRAGGRGAGCLRGHTQGQRTALWHRMRAGGLGPGC